MSKEGKPIIKDSMVGDSRLISKKTSVVIKKIALIRDRKDGNRKLLEGLTDYNTKLTGKLNELKSSGNCKKEKEQTHNVSKLVREMESIDEQLKVERAFLADLQNQISQVSLQEQKTVKKKAEIIKHSLGDVNLSFHNNNKKIDKSKEILNEKMHVESVHLSNDLTKNSELKEKIRVLMSERKYFNKEYNNLLAKLKKGKLVMEDLRDTVNHANTMRQNITQKLEQINDKEKKLKALQEQEAVDLTMRYDTELEMRDFILNKTASRKNSVALGKMHKLSMNKSCMDDQTLKHHRLLLANLSDIYHLRDSVVSDSDDFYKVYELLKAIKKDKSEFTSLFTYVTNLYHELEVVKERLCKKEQEIQELSEDQLEQEIFLEDNIKQLECLKANLEDVKANILDNVLSNRRDLDKLYRGIEMLINVCKADVSPLLALLGNNDNITDLNYKMFLEALETRLVVLMSSLMYGSLTTSAKRWQVAPASVVIPQVQGEDAVMEDKVLITQPCEVCFPPIKRGSLAAPLDSSTSLRDVKLTLKKPNITK